MFLPNDITLRPGDSGDHVAELQRRLAQRDLLGESNVNGSYDGPTTQAVMQFQSINGLRSDGVAGPQTLRLLISIGASDEGDAGGSATSEEEEKQAYGHDPERADALAMQAEGEQEKLANEAVWGYGGAEVEAASDVQTAQGQQQLSDLDRYNQQHLQGEQQMAAIDEAQAQQAQASQGPEQLKIDQQEMKAQTVADDLKERPQLHDAETKGALEDGPDHPPLPQEPSAQAASQAPQLPPEPAAQPNIETKVAIAPPRDPALARTEAQLDAPSAQESQSEGKKLDARGVKDRGTIPESELGGLSPEQSPTISREQEIAKS
jgi:peptidoglycan hydrolase-like protein with peptidoglycan-binding domain